jgi:hypothetical protein
VPKTSGTRSLFLTSLLASLLAVGCVSPQAGSLADAEAPGDDATLAGDGESSPLDADRARDDGPELRDAPAPSTAEVAADAAEPDDGPAAPDAPPPADTAPPPPSDAINPPALLATGQPCKTNGQCSSSHCVDQICCGSACDGTCNSCAKVNTGLADGTCGPTRDGTDPHDDCAPGNPPCGRDGACDGKGQCRFAGTEVTCGQERCANSLYTAPSVCDGKGGCPTPDPISCGTYPCQGSRCAMTCSPSLLCPSGLYCDATSKCQPKKNAGSSCEVDGQCATGHCTAEHVCCDSACGSQCQSCLAANTGTRDGQCAAVKAGLDPFDQCQADPTSSCLKDGSCDGLGGCRQYAQGTACRSARCMDGAGESTETSAATCNGGGSCVDSAPSRSCGLYVCGGTSCKKTCASSSECLGANYCDPASHCSPQKSFGTVCGRADECASGICGGFQTGIRNGRCCAQSCTCPQPSAGNLLANPGFDQNLSSWKFIIGAGADISRSSFYDADSCQYSGQMQMIIGDSTDAAAWQCVSLSGSAASSYYFGGMIRASAVSESVTNGLTPWEGDCRITFYATGADCLADTSPLGEKYLVVSTAPVASDTWYAFGSSLTTPGGSGAIRYKCETVDDGAPFPTTIYFDKLYLNASGSATY